MSRNEQLLAAMLNGETPTGEPQSRMEALLHELCTKGLKGTVFPEGLKTTFPIGNVELVNGIDTLVPPGGTLEDFFKIFIEEMNPETVQPKVALTFSQAKAYEVGEKITPAYSATLDPGSYSYGPDTGVVATSWEVTDSRGSTPLTTASGKFPELQVTDGMSYTITAKAKHTAGATPVTNTGKNYAAGEIPAGEKSATSTPAVTGFRRTFYGTLTEKGTLDSGKIRGLAGKSKTALKNGSSFTVDVPVGAMRVVIAYPATLQKLTTVKDNAVNFPIEDGFEESTVKVAGLNDYNAVDYRVYVLDFAQANDTANTYTVTI